MKRFVICFVCILIGGIANAQDSDQATRQEQRLQRIIEDHIGRLRTKPRQLVIGANAPSEFKEFLSEVTSKIERKASRLLEAREEIHGVAVVESEIAATGEVTKVRLIVSSGNIVTDQAALQSIQLANPFPPFAAAMRERADSIILVKQIRFARARSSEEGRPPSGISVDATRTVALFTEPPARCVSFQTQGVTVLLDQAEIERQAAVSLGPDWKTEAERMAFIAARRAQELLSSLSDERDRAGCRQLKMIDRSESVYLVGNALEAGQAYVVAPAENRSVASIRVRYLGVRSGPTFGRGEILFYLPQEPQPFFVMSWWVS